MNRISMIAATGILALGLAGCATQQMMQATHSPAPPIPRAVALATKGRAFTVGTVTVSKTAIPKADIGKHCLPGSMYAAMLRYNLVIAFRRAGLTQGRGPALPVNVVITERRFATNVGGLRAGGFIARVAFDGYMAPVGMNGTGGWPWVNEVPSWRLEQRLIPAFAAKVTNDLLAVRAGHPIPTDRMGSRTVGAYVHGSIFNDAYPTYRLANPMTPAEIERITGKTGSQLNAICHARIAAAN